MKDWQQRQLFRIAEHVEDVIRLLSEPGVRALCGISPEDEAIVAKLGSDARAAANKGPS